MRLIDADALKKVFHAEWDGVLVWDEGGETTADEFCNLVDNAPTIEAEPTIEQINNYCEKRNLTILTNELFYHLQKRAYCGARMSE